jgi:hypothetical protein
MVAHANELDHIRANTWHDVNERLDAEAAVRIQAAARAGDSISNSLARIDREWNFERVLETEASTMGLMGLALALRFGPRFLFVPGFVAAMVFLHAIQGWYPLLPIFRRIGVRSQDEIDRERYALKALRGDFDGVRKIDAETERAAAAWRAVCA